MEAERLGYRGGVPIADLLRYRAGRFEERVGLFCGRSGDHCLACHQAPRQGKGRIGADQRDRPLEEVGRSRGIAAVERGGAGFREMLPGAASEVR